MDSVFENIFLVKRLGPLKRVYDDIQLADLHGFLFQDKVVKPFQKRYHHQTIAF